MSLTMNKPELLLLQVTAGHMHYFTDRVQFVYTQYTIWIYCIYYSYYEFYWHIYYLLLLLYLFYLNTFRSTKEWQV